MGLGIPWCTSRKHYAGIINRGNLIFLISSLTILFFSHVGSAYSITLYMSRLYFFYILYFQGLNLLELAAHLEEKAAQLRHEGLGHIKIALAGTDTSSLLEIIEGHFGHVNLDTSILTTSTEKSKEKVTTNEKIVDVQEKLPVTPDVSGLASAELVFPLKSVPTVIAGLPQSYLPLCGPKTLSR